MKIHHISIPLSRITLPSNPKVRGLSIPLALVEFAVVRIIDGLGGRTVTGTANAELYDDTDYAPLPNATPKRLTFNASPTVADQSDEDYGWVLSNARLRADISFTVDATGRQVTEHFEALKVELD